MKEREKRIKICLASVVIVEKSMEKVWKEFLLKLIVVVITIVYKFSSDPVVSTELIININQTH